MVYLWWNSGVYFLEFRDTEIVLANANKLRNTPVNINRDYPKEIANSRKNLWPELKRLRGLHPNSKISIVYPAKIVADGHVLADTYPDWSEVLNGDRITTNAHHSPNGNYSHQSLGTKPRQYDVHHRPASGDKVPTPKVTQHSQVHNTQSKEQYEGASDPTVHGIHTNTMSSSSNEHNHTSRRPQSESPAPARRGTHAPISQRLSASGESAFQRPWTSKLTNTHANTVRSSTCVNSRTPQTVHTNTDGNNVHHQTANCENPSNSPK
ncbi:hypothetical protein DPMN_089340 [Dreissena polymorpha]|uniref:Uncharacterized protein n=1 Tax=Dreissena polymorpha TaxID=45954 RepID=A0A9D4KVS6_DREPO|nr:hypothetical protein DPMN_089340 [Dreissena polymorpha]